MIQSINENLNKKVQESEFFDKLDSELEQTGETMSKIDSFLQKSEKILR